MEFLWCIGISWDPSGTFSMASKCPSVGFYIVHTNNTPSICRSSNSALHRNRPRKLTATDLRPRCPDAPGVGDLRVGSLRGWLPQYLGAERSSSGTAPGRLATAGGLGGEHK